MSLNNFIPALWSDTLLAAYRKDLVFGNLFNRDYQGTIAQMGDTVKINAIGDINIFNYAKDTDLNPPQSLTDAQTMLVINQAKYYNFDIDDVDQAQSQPHVMSEAMAWAGYRVADTVDQFLATFYTDVAASNLVGSAGTPVVPSLATSANIGNGTTVYDYVVVLAQFLTQSLVPRQGRWAVVPPWIKTALTQDVRFTGSNTADARLTILNGNLDASAGMASGAYLGRVENLDIYESVNCPHLSGTIGLTGSVDVILAGHTMAVTMAEGLVKTEGYRPPYRFSDAIKGLCLYGAKTVRPYALAAAVLQHP